MSQAGEVAIVNQALGLLGQDPIMSLDQEGRSAEWSNILWPQARDAVLSLHPWSCALERAQLARLGTAPLAGFAYAYQLPSSPYCLRPWAMEGTPDTGQPWPWRVRRRSLETDAEAALITYSCRLTDTTLFDPLLVEALAAHLAWKLAYVLAGNKRKVPEMLTIFEGAMAQAKNADGRQGLEAPENQTSSYVTGRW